MFSALSNTGIKIADSVFTHNTAVAYGGAMYFGEQHAGTLSVVNSVIEYNTAYRAGGR